LAGDPTGRYDSSYWYYQPAETRVRDRLRSKIEYDESTQGVAYNLKW